MASFYVACFYMLTTLSAVVSSSRLVAIPTVPFNESSSGTYHISNIATIIIDQDYANWKDHSGETLIPPRLSEFAGTFASDLRDIFHLNITISVASSPQPNSIFLTIDEKSSYWYASGDSSSEGYTFEITPSGITVSGASPLGVWWASRSLIQQSIILEGELSVGKTVDFPGWKTRGMMLDAARHYYPAEFITDLCSYMSFFKQNTLHLHLSDNLYNNVKIYSRERSLSLYARFRLWSESADVKGLNKFKNESYTKEQFKGIQSSCVARGVTIISEIESPGHALPIVQWKPELGLNTDLSLLNISHPDTIPTMKTIWSVFMDWFDSKTVHIGADEYTAEVSEYNRFVNEMAQFICINGSKSVRIWGTFPPKPDYENISKDVSIQHWAFFEDNPLYDYIKNNYTVVNSDDTFYVVNKNTWSGGYPYKVNTVKTFTGNPANNGPWYPHIFDTKNSTNNPERSNKFILGAVAPLWNDFGANASVYSEAYYAWREGIPALADKQWGGDLTQEEFTEVFPILRPRIPGQNLERSIPSKTSTILYYDRDSWIQNQHHPNQNIVSNHGPRIPVTDKSPNSYDATTNCTLTPRNTLEMTPSCTLKTPLLSKGRNYTLSLRLYISQISSHDVTILSGKDSSLKLTPNITLLASGNHYRLNSTVPTNTWVDLRVIGRGDHTYASVRETSLEDPFPGVSSLEIEEEFQAILGINGESFVWTPVAIEAPISQVGGSEGGWTGEFSGLVLSSEA